MPALHFASVRGTCGDCAHSPSLCTKTSCSRFRCILGEFLVDLVLGVDPPFASRSPRDPPSASDKSPCSSPAAVGYALLFFFIISPLLTRNRSCEYRYPSSIAILWLHAVFGNLVLPLSLTSFHHWLFRLSCCLCSLNHCSSWSEPSVCCTSALAGGVLLQLYFVVVYDSVVRFWPPPTPQLSIAPLRDCWFAVGALAPQKGSLQPRGLLFVRIGSSFTEVSVSLFTGCVHPHDEGFHRGLRLTATLCRWSDFTPSGLWDILPLQFASALQHHCVVCTTVCSVFRPASLGGH